MLKFDLIVANYNNSKYLDKFFNSIINSTVKPEKIIFVDDLSTDDSVLIVNKYIEAAILNIELHVNKKNLGFANSLNIAIKHLRSKYFARLDPDDYVESNRFELQSKFLLNNPLVDLVGSNVNYYVGDKFIRSSDVILSSDEIERTIKKAILPIIHGSIMGKSEIFSCKLYNQEMVPSEDYDLFSTLVLNNFILVNLKDKLTNVLIHPTSVSFSLKYSTIKIRFDLAFNNFKYKKSAIFICFEYVHQFYYRKYLFSQSILKYYYLLISVFAAPFKVLIKLSKLFFQKIGKNYD